MFGRGFESRHLHRLSVFDPDVRLLLRSTLVCRTEAGIVPEPDKRLFWNPIEEVRIENLLRKCELILLDHSWSSSGIFRGEGPEEEWLFPLMVVVEYGGDAHALLREVADLTGAHADSHVDIYRIVAGIEAEKAAQDGPDRNSITESHIA